MRGSYSKDGIRRGRKINMEAPNEDLGLNCACSRGAVHIHEPLRLTRWRRIAGPEAGGHQAVLIAQVRRQDGESYRVCRAAVDHTVTVECIDAHTIEGRLIRKLVHGQVVGVGPHTELWIVAEE